MYHARSIHAVMFDVLGEYFACNHEKLGRFGVVKPDENQG